MKGLLSVIRWKFVLPVGILIAAIVVFFVVFFDPIAERAIEGVASRVNGAKVEIDGLKTKFFKGRVDIARLQVTDRERPMTNVVETAAMAFQMDPSEVARMRFVINEAAIKGLQFGTRRATSGAMPRLEKKAEDGPPGPAEKLFNQYQGRFKVSLKGMADEAKRRIEFDPKQTIVYKRSMELQERSKTLPNDWEARVDGLQAEPRLKKIEADVESVKNTNVKGPEAITAVPEALKKLNQARADLAKLRDDVKAARDSITGDIRSYRQGILSLNDAKKQDMDDLMSRLNLDFADPQRLMESVIGPVVLDRFRTILKYIEIARRHMPSKKEKESVKKRERAGGTIIEFPTPAAPPRFWLQRAALDGKYQDIAAQGQMSDLTTDPARAGRPFKLNLDGARGAQRYAVGAVLDHVTDVAKDSFTMKASGIDLASVTGSSGTALTGGSAAAEMAVSVIGDGGIGGSINVSLSGVKLDRAQFFSSLDVPTDGKLSTEDRIKADFAGNLVSSLEAMPQISVNAQLFGTWNDPRFKLSSNLTDAFTGVVKTSVGNLVKDQRADVEKKLDTLVAQEKARLEAEAAKLEAKLNERLGKIQDDIDREMKEAAGVSLPTGAAPGLKVPKLDKIFK